MRYWVFIFTLIASCSSEKRTVSHLHDLGLNGPIKKVVEILGKYTKDFFFKEHSFDIKSTTVFNNNGYKNIETTIVNKPERGWHSQYFYRNNELLYVKTDMKFPDKVLTTITVPKTNALGQIVENRHYSSNGMENRTTVIKLTKNLIFNTHYYGAVVIHHVILGGINGKYVHDSFRNIFYIEFSFPMKWDSFFNPTIIIRKRLYQDKGNFETAEYLYKYVYYSQQ